MLDDRVDPMIGGLLEGAAFLAARVQLKIKHEFADFTTNLLDQLAPHYLAPTPSFVLVEAQPKYGDPGLARRPHGGARRQFRGDVSRGPAQHRLPVHAGRADRLMAVRHRQRRVFPQRRPAAGPDSRRRRRLRRQPPAATHRSRGGAPGGRTRRQRGADAARTSFFLMPGEIAALPPARPGDGRRRPLRASVRALSGRLFSRSRRFRRSDCRARTNRHDPADRVRERRGADCE